MVVKENDENGVVTSTTETDIHHWAFLEEIEAPMWVDLSLESKLLTQDNDDAWFQMSHPFHHHSARHLRSAFAHPDVGSDLFNFNLRGECSSQLPSSVSKSRGKHYRSRVWRSNHHGVSLDKGHPINDLGGMVSNHSTNVSSQRCRPQVSCGNQTEVSSSVTSVLYDSERRVALNSQSASTSGVSSSTITSVSWQRDSNVLGMQKDAFGVTSGLLNSLRISLRKSHATRPASRVHKSSDDKSCVGSSSTTGSYDTKGKNSGRKSSTGKSSVGSSSTGNDMKGKGFAVLSEADHCEQVKLEINSNIKPKGLKVSSGRPNLVFSNPKFEVKRMGAHFKSDKVKRLDFGDYRKSAKPINGRVKVKKMSEAFLSARDDYCSKIEVKDRDTPCGGLQASKSKDMLQKDILNQSRLAQAVKGKVGTLGSNQFTCSGKENLRARAVLSGGKENVPAGAASDPKLLKLKSNDKVRVASIGSKVRKGSTTKVKMSRDSPVYLR